MKAFEVRSIITLKHYSKTMRYDAYDRVISWFYNHLRSLNSKIMRGKQYTHFLSIDSLKFENDYNISFKFDINTLQTLCGPSAVPLRSLCGPSADPLCGPSAVPLRTLFIFSEKSKYIFQLINRSDKKIKHVSIFQRLMFSR